MIRPSRGAAPAVVAVIKIIPPDAYVFAGPRIVLLKRGRYGFGANDRRTLVKTAGEGFAQKLARLELGPGEELALNLALSTTEATGANRNGDGFRADWCRSNHPTFVKHARPYRNHDNKPTSPAYGVVKASHFNEEMQRIELAIVYNATKEAADRNKGEVADLEMEKLAADDVFPTSMACTVRVDICSGCGNRARNRREYCRGAMCKYGGLHENIGKTFSDGHHLHADNPDPRWFDISHIVGGRGADRTSFTLGLVKRAGEAAACGAALADELEMTTPFLADGADPAGAARAKVACALTDATACDPAHAAAFVGAEVSLPPHPGGVSKAAEALRALADAGVLLSPRAFLEFSGVEPKTAAAIAPDLADRLRDAYAEVAADPGVAGDSFVPAASAGGAARKWAAEVADAAGCSPRALARRAVRGVVRPAPVPTGGVRVDPAAAFGLAVAYASYKTAAIAAAPAADRDRLTAVARAQDLAALNRGIF